MLENRANRHSGEASRSLLGSVRRKLSLTPSIFETRKTDWYRSQGVHSEHCFVVRLLLNWRVFNSRVQSDIPLFLFFFLYYHTLGYFFFRPVYIFLFSNASFACSHIQRLICQTSPPILFLPMLVYPFPPMCAESLPKYNSQVIMLSCTLFKARASASMFVMSGFSEAIYESLINRVKRSI